MKNIRVYQAAKYLTDGYERYGDCYFAKDGHWFISLTFEQEPELGEGHDSTEISQYPLEDILDRFLVYVSDFYKKENAEKKAECCLEFSSSSIDQIKALSTIVGKHVYNREEILFQSYAADIGSVFLFCTLIDHISLSGFCICHSYCSDFFLLRLLPLHLSYDIINSNPPLQRKLIVHADQVRDRIPRFPYRTDFQVRDAGHSCALSINYCRNSADVP